MGCLLLDPMSQGKRGADTTREHSIENGFVPWSERCRYYYPCTPPAPPPHRQGRRGRSGLSSCPAPHFCLSPFPCWAAPAPHQPAGEVPGFPLALRYAHVSKVKKTKMWIIHVHTCKETYRYACLTCQRGLHTYQKRPTDGSSEVQKRHQSAGYVPRFPLVLRQAHVPKETYM